MDEIAQIKSDVSTERVILSSGSYNENELKVMYNGLKCELKHPPSVTRTGIVQMQKKYSLSA